ncbi:indole-3-glycerol phosphate synthase TrpC [Pyrococcus abyssi]|uniref:Indole-3-glycerol phosphate synthase n=1 Tax=Pyrococcus abyssi (strain GE5 / Orsay) TaxID=272844 RepID=TRPC_PYRAB|nr:indole-3-glycerol phosphate synthase TrpC [Pyrococcus abyssi]Q9V1G3.1 RecName: Full=Indole-3-glycerol phosphate synthase; Short=IGPS [Pyrococcus abyssi GE5]CAB49386.1 trpC indole-3-glycerol phosphate synthase (EC 4.1.1.48) (IGPS) [Pyrococcus abyssi GE5]CCE69847.1 TPA: indole-3-glycerol-phosphate synthase [Pyrococcus abyssi GE5]
MVIFGLSRRIKRCTKNPIIAELKVYSPKYGDLLRGRDPLEILRRYERAGAVGISYITDPKYFRGNFDFFKRLCKETELPVLRKDFITTKEEIEKTAEAGGSAVLLITRLLKDKLPEFVDHAREHGLDTLVEVHTLEELKIAIQTNSTMIGINNRDIGKLELDDGNVSLTAKLAPLIPDKFVKVSESGITTLEDLKVALKYADAALIGTALMKTEDPEKLLKSFVEAKIC